MEQQTENEHIKIKNKWKNIEPKKQRELRRKRTIWGALGGQGRGPCLLSSSVWRRRQRGRELPSIDRGVTLEHISGYRGEEGLGVLSSSRRTRQVIIWESDAFVCIRCCLSRWFSSVNIQFHCFVIAFLHVMTAETPSKPSIPNKENKTKKIMSAWPPARKGQAVKVWPWKLWPWKRKLFPGM